MPDTPPESDSSPSGEPDAEVDAGERKEPASGEPPAVASVPQASGAPAPVAETEEARTLAEEEDGFGRWSVRIGEVFDFGEQGSFTVKERLGRGGMGEVYRAEYVTPAAPKFVQVFALKVLRPDARPHEQRTFIDEVHLLSLLRHETIARYHTYFMDHGRQVLVMEYVEGRSLHSLIRLAWRKGQVFSESTTLELLAQVAEALDYAHAAKDEQGRPLNIVHRDVSPANIMVTTAGFAKLVDFGVAKADLDGRTKTVTGARLIKGKIPYLSPEQVERRPLDGRSDLFSLCCVLVEMLTGDPPFGRMMDLATLRSISQVAPKDVDRVTRGLSKKVRAICRKGLAREPARRFANGCEVARAMLAHHDYLGPTAVREEIARLEALPDLTPEIVDKLAADLRRVQRRRRTVERIGGLACAAVAAFFIWNAYRSTPPAPAAAPPPVVAVPHEQPMSPTPEQGALTVKDETKSQAPIPAVAKAGPQAPTQVGGTRSNAKKAVTCVLIAGITGCAHVVKTGTRAGDCYLNEEPAREFKEKPIQEKLDVLIDMTNEQGNCAGKDLDPDTPGWVRDEPCPVYEGPIVLSVRMRMFGGPVTDKSTRAFSYTPAKAYGKTSIFETRGAFSYPGYYNSARNYSGRMTALVTQIITSEGKKVPICGVLFGPDGLEGIPILTPEYKLTPPGPKWGHSTTLHLFWPK